LENIRLHMVPPTDEPTLVTYFDLKDKLKKYE